MAVEYQGTHDVPLARLTRFPGNAKRGDVEAIRESLRRHGQYRSLVVRVDGEQLVILAGNHTRDALRAENHQTARCELITCTDDEARRINLGDNRIAELGTTDTDALLELLSLLDDDYSGTGFTEAQVQALLEPPPAFPDTNGLDGDPLPTWGVVVQCDDEFAQTALLRQLSAEGWKARALKQ